MYKICRILLALTLGLCLFAVGSSASGVTVQVKGSPLSGAFLEDGTTWVPLRKFCESRGSTVGWDNATQSITVTDKNFKARITLGDRLVEADGRSFWLSAAPICREGITYVPVRGLAKLYGFTVGWDDKTQTVSLTGGKAFADAGQFYDRDALYWLSHIIFAESGDEPLEGQVAVGNVVMNRVASSNYPDTIWGVIFDTKYGVQFTPTKSGSIYKEPSEASVLAAKLVLEGAEVVPDNAVYFISSKVSDSNWIKRTCQKLAVIGDHTFFADPA